MPESVCRALEPKGGGVLKRYETVFIIPVGLSDDESQKVIERYENIIERMKGMLLKIDKWGKRKMAYEIKKHANGFYILMDYAGTSALVTELERNLKIDDRVLKYMTVKIADTVDIQALEEEIKSAQKEELHAASKDKTVKGNSGVNVTHEIEVNAAVSEKTEKDAKEVEE